MYAFCQFFRSKIPKNQHFWRMHFSKVADCKFAYTPFLDQVGNPLVFFCRNYGFWSYFMLYYYCSKWSIGLKSIRHKHILIIVKIWDAKTYWHTMFYWLRRYTRKHSHIQPYSKCSLHSFAIQSIKPTRRTWNIVLLFFW